ncbi:MULTISPECIES: hypothetical protein [unclassified Nocardia]|uniref:hypothetical protein n=1 Tax=unclassified Nocardia TaxID=2637762 RepID=UPI001CE3DFC8|nr:MULTISPECIES: hypothetical protein [unclassified Nocardia]
MADVQINFGSNEIKAFNEAARAGSIKFDEQAVREAVRLYDTMIKQLVGVRNKLSTLRDRKGFGGFTSGQELQAGFSGKASEGIEVISQLIEGAMRLQEAYLRAGDLIQEADQRNADMLKFLNEPTIRNDARL